jgi:hypothetical protein
MTNVLRLGDIVRTLRSGGRLANILARRKHFAIRPDTNNNFDTGPRFRG